MYDNSPCLTDEQVNLRIYMERKGIHQMQDEGYPVRTMVAWQSPLTFETHMMPIMETDTWQDVCNRYFDLFPREAELVMQEITDQRQLLDKNGFSADKTMLLIGRVPKGLEKMLDFWHQEGDFWTDTKLRKSFFNHFNKFKLARPNATLN